MASEATDDDQAVVLGDEFVADEILARLPARCAVRCTVLSKRFRQLVASPHFWLRHHRLGAPLELPHAARLYRYFGCKTFHFHVVGPAFAMKHTVQVEDDDSWYASTCNGLVLVSSTPYGNKRQSSVDGVVFNPATGEEARLSLPLPLPRSKRVERRILGFGYGPSSKLYKVLIREDSEDDNIVDDDDTTTTRLMVVSMDGQEPREVFSCSEGFPCSNVSLHTGDGKVYFLTYTLYLPGEDGREVDDWEATSVLAFDVDNEVVTSIAVPEGHKDNIELARMLEIRGRPCIYGRKGHDIVIWSLTPDDHRWEQLYILVNESYQPGDCFAGAWECGAGLLFTLFRTSGAYLYNLQEAEVAVKQEESGGNRLTAVSSVAIQYEWPEPIKYAALGNPTNLLDYRPTLISPASVLGDAAFSGCPPRESVAPTHEFDVMFLEMTEKSILDPAMQMLSNL